MTRHFGVKSVYIFAMFIVASLVSQTAVGVNFKEEKFILDITPLKQNSGKPSFDFRNKTRPNNNNTELTDDKVTQLLEELELRAQRLETSLIEHQKQDDLRINVKFRTCQELHQANSSLSSGMYWIDPDGQGFGDDAIYVHCDMTTGTSSVRHDSEIPITVDLCHDPGCYSRLINYTAPMRQMIALAERSSECHQSIQYQCNVAPLEINGVAQSWWNDRNGVAQYFWAGSNSSIHTCQCGIDNDCVKTCNTADCIDVLCNCDKGANVPLQDYGVITDKNYLPITQLNFGHIAGSPGFHTLGRFECTGEARVSGMPASCSDLWKIGHTSSGMYSVMGPDQVEAVHCNFAKLPNEQGFQSFVGFSDVKSSPVYFHAQAPYNSGPPDNMGRAMMRFDSTVLNIGGAMNSSSGVFTAPRSGIYSFSFTGVGRYYSRDGAELMFALVVNGNEVGRAVTRSRDDSFHTHSFHSTLELKTGDLLWTAILTSNNAQFYDETHVRYNHFTGHLLLENVAKSLNL